MSFLFIAFLKCMFWTDLTGWHSRKIRVILISSGKNHLETDGEVMKSWMKSWIQSGILNNWLLIGIHQEKFKSKTCTWVENINVLWVSRTCFFQWEKTNLLTNY